MFRRRGAQFVAGGWWHASVVPGTAAGREVTDDRPDTDSDGYCLIGIIAHRLVRGFGSFDRFISNAAVDLFAAIQRRREPLASLADFLSGHVSRGSHQRPRILGERAQIVFMWL